MTRITSLVWCALALPLMACANVNSAIGGASNMTGDAWYTETTAFFGLATSSRVFYCPAPIGRDRAACHEAVMFALDDSSPQARRMSQEQVQRRQQQLRRRMLQIQHEDEQRRQESTPAPSAGEPAGVPRHAEPR